MDLPAAGHLEKVKIDIPFDLNTKSEQLLDAYLILKADAMHLPAGHLMAREQFVLGQYDFSVKKETPAKNQPVQAGRRLCGQRRSFQSGCIQENRRAELL